MPTEKTASTLIPGEILPAEGEVVLNAGRPVQSVTVLNTGDRPIQVGSHYHFFEANRALRFPRATTFGLRLDIPAGTAVRFEPGEEKVVQLVPFGGQRTVFGLNGLTKGNTQEASVRQQALQKASEQGFLSSDEETGG